MLLWSVGGLVCVFVRWSYIFFAIKKKSRTKEKFAKKALLECLCIYKCLKISESLFCFYCFVFVFFLLFLQTFIYQNFCCVLFFCKFYFNLQILSGWQRQLQHYPSKILKLSYSLQQFCALSLTHMARFTPTGIQPQQQCCRVCAFCICFRSLTLSHMW